MKLRYTSLQADVGSAEEELEGDAWGGLDGAPVVACGLHSQVACVAVAFKHALPDGRLAYVMTDGGALPAVLSDLLAGLRSAGLVDTVVTCGQAFGGDHEAVNVSSALQVAVASAGADAIVTGPGPGAVGTGSELGFSGLEVVDAVDATGRLGGTPVLAVRYSDADSRPRHRGVSHHTSTVLRQAGAALVVPVPRGDPVPPLPGDLHAALEVDPPDMAALLSGRGLDVTTMGRGPAEDPGFFRYAAAAGVAAAQSLTR